MFCIIGRHQCTIAGIMNFWLMGISLAVLVLLVILFAYEERSGERKILPGLREGLDKLLHKLHHKLTHISIHVGTGSFRLMVHFVIHKVLSFVVRILQWFENNLYSLLKRNRKVAKNIEAEQVKTHLHLIAEHKESSALSEDEKRKLKDKAIEAD